MDPISRGTLNRTTLQRQWLLERKAVPTIRAIEHLVGMQAQNPHDPYWGLWSRIENFDPDDLSNRIDNREVVRGQLLRSTIHLVSTTDYLGLRPQLQPVLARTLGSTAFARDTNGLDQDALLAQGRALLRREPLTRAELGRMLEERWGGVPAASLAQVVTYLLPVVQVPPRGLWKQKGQARWATIQSWVGSELIPDWSLEDTVLRYLGAFGPASTADMRVWSGLPGLRSVVEKLRPDLRTYRDESGVELLDLPDLDIVDARAPAPPRFLPEYDNLLLGHSDRSRFFVDGVIPQGFSGNLLVDGVFSGAWKTTTGRNGTRLEIIMMRGISAAERRQVASEVELLLAFVSSGEEVTEVTWQES